MIVVTPGCPAGVGPEVAVLALATARIPARTKLAFASSTAVLLEGARRARVQAAPGEAPHEIVLRRGGFARRVRCLAPVAAGFDDGERVAPGAPTDAALACQRDALLLAGDLVARGDATAIVTAPTRKRALSDVHHPAWSGGRAFPGQTELVHALLAADGDPPLMVFAGGPFLLGLATVHLPLRDVPAAITAGGLEVALRRLAQAVQRIEGRTKARLAVLGVNPHAGEGGLLGIEEQDVVAPTLARLRQASDGPLDAHGPLPADGFFADVARGHGRRFHGILAMHHDQGLAPYKLLTRGRGVNVTWGIRGVRTSPDHGTADALAGTGKADASSMRAALELAVRLAATADRRPKSSV